MSKPQEPLKPLKLELSIDVEPQHVIDLITGTGALSWDWWIDYQINEKRQTVKLTAIAEDDDRKRVTKTLSFADIVAAASTAFQTDHLSSYADFTDELGMMDANDSDIILQLAMFGRVVFG